MAKIFIRSFFMCRGDNEKNTGSIDRAALLNALEAAISAHDKDTADELVESLNELVEKACRWAFAFDWEWDGDDKQYLTTFANKIRAGEEVRCEDEESVCVYIPFVRQRDESLLDTYNRISAQADKAILEMTNPLDNYDEKFDPADWE